MYLVAQFSICFEITIWTDSLLEEGEQDRDDDAAFEAFSKADEEDWLS